MKQGIPVVAATLGAEGAVAGAEGRIYRVRIPKIVPVNTVGSGDSFVAGYAYGHARGWPAAECLRYAAAAGSANALSRTTGDVDPSDTEGCSARSRSRNGYRISDASQLFAQKLGVHAPGDLGFFGSDDKSTSVFEEQEG